MCVCVFLCVCVHVCVCVCVCVYLPIDPSGDSGLDACIATEAQGLHFLIEGVDELACFPGVGESVCVSVRVCARMT